MSSNNFIETLKRGIAILLSLCLLWTSGNVAQAADLAPEVFAGVSNLPQFQLIPPERLGRIADYFNASGDVKPLIILIQDLHAHYGVQKHISGLLDFLAAKLPHLPTSPLPFAVAVEGAQGPIDSSILALFPDPKIKAQAADYLMREGELTGAENFAVMRGIPDLLVGVENDQYYNLNRELFRKTLADRQELVSLLKGLEADISSLQKRIYGPALRDFQKKLDAYDKGEMSTSDFIAMLTSSPAVSNGGPIDLKRDFPVLASFTINSRFGTMEQIRTATAEFFTNSATYLSAEEKKNLSVLAKQPDSTVYYLYVRELIYKHQLFLAAPPELASYLEYLHTEQTMGMDRVTHEASELAFQIKLGLAHESKEKDLVQVQHDLDLLTRIADLQATEFEVKDFGPRLNQFVALCKSLMESNGIRSFDEAKVRALISSSIDYYAMALMRNQPMIDNTLALIGEGNAGPHPATAVLVAGGFHTAPLTELLRKRNISYLVITPRVDSLTEADHDLYIKRLSGNLLTVDDVLAAAPSMFGAEPSGLASLLHKLPADAVGKGLAAGIFIAGIGTVALVALARASVHGAALDRSHLKAALNNLTTMAPSWAHRPNVFKMLDSVKEDQVGPGAGDQKVLDSRRRRWRWTPAPVAGAAAGKLMAGLAAGQETQASSWLLVLGGLFSRMPWRQTDTDTESAPPTDSQLRDLGISLASPTADIDMLAAAFERLEEKDRIRFWNLMPASLQSKVERALAPSLLSSVMGFGSMQDPAEIALNNYYDEISTTLNQHLNQLKLSAVQPRLNYWKWALNSPIDRTSNSFWNKLGYRERYLAEQSIYNAIISHREGSPWRTISLLNIITRNHLQIAGLRTTSGVRLFELVTYNRSAFFRNEPIHFWSKFRVELDRLIAEKRQEALSTGQKQILRIGAFGAAFGQEPTSMAIEMVRALRRAQINPGIIDFEIHVFDLPGAVFDDVRNNRIAFAPEAIPNTTIQEIDEEGSYFQETGKGMVRSDRLQSRMRFHDINLLNPATWEAARPAQQLDFLTIHNVLQYLQPNYISSPQEFPSIVRDLRVFITSMLRSEGRISASSSDAENIDNSVWKAFSGLASFGPRAGAYFIDPRAILPVVENSPESNNSVAQLPATLTHPITRWFANYFVAPLLRSYYRLTGQREKAEAIGRLASDARRTWVEQEFSPGFEKWFWLLAAEWFEMGHGEITPQYTEGMTPEERAQAEALARQQLIARYEGGKNLGQIARDTFNGLLRGSFDELPSWVRPFVAWSYQESTPFWLRVLLHLAHANTAANATKAPHKAHNIRWKDTQAVLTPGGQTSGMPKLSDAEKRIFERRLNTNSALQTAVQAILSANASTLPDVLTHLLGNTNDPESMETWRDYDDDLMEITAFENFVEYRDWIQQARRMADEEFGAEEDRPYAALLKFILRIPPKYQGALSLIEGNFREAGLASQAQWIGRFRGQEWLDESPTQENNGPVIQEVVGHVRGAFDLGGVSRIQVSVRHEIEIQLKMRLQEMATLKQASSSHSAIVERIEILEKRLSEFAHGPDGRFLVNYGPLKWALTNLQRKNQNSENIAEFLDRVDEQLSLIPTLPRLPGTGLILLDEEWKPVTDPDVVIPLQEALALLEKYWPERYQEALSVCSSVLIEAKARQRHLGASTRSRPFMPAVPYPFTGTVADLAGILLEELNHERFHLFYGRHDVIEDLLYRVPVSIRHELSDLGDPQQYLSEFSAAVELIEFWRRVEAGAGEDAALRQFAQEERVVEETSARDLMASLQQMPARVFTDRGIQVIAFLSDALKQAQLAATRAESEGASTSEKTNPPNASDTARAENLPESSEPAPSEMVAQRLAARDPAFQGRFQQIREILRSHTAVTAQPKMPVPDGTVLHFTDERYQPWISLARDLLAYELAIYHVIPTSTDRITFVAKGYKGQMKKAGPFAISVSNGKVMIGLPPKTFTSVQGMRDGLVSELAHASDYLFVDALGQGPHETDGASDETNLAREKMVEALDIIRNGIYAPSEHKLQPVDLLLTRLGLHNQMDNMGPHERALTVAHAIQKVADMAGDNRALQEWLWGIGQILIAFGMNRAYEEVVAYEESYDRAEDLFSDVKGRLANIKTSDQWKANREAFVREMRQIQALYEQFVAKAIMSRPILTAPALQDPESAQDAAKTILMKLDEAIAQLSAIKSVDGLNQSPIIKAIRDSEAFEFFEARWTDRQLLTRIGIDYEVELLNSPEALLQSAAWIIGQANIENAPDPARAEAIVKALTADLQATQQEIDKSSKGSDTLLENSEVSGTEQPNAAPAAPDDIGNTLTDNDSAEWIKNEDLKTEIDLPAPVLNEEAAIAVRSVDLNKLPVGTLVHYDISNSRWNYILRIESNGHVSIWLRGDPGAISAPISKIGDLDIIHNRLPNGHLVEGHTAYMPYFHNEFGKLEYAGIEGWNDSPERVRIYPTYSDPLPEDAFDRIPDHEFNAIQLQESADAFVNRICLMLIARAQGHGDGVFDLASQQLHEIGLEIGLSPSQIEHYSAIGQSQDPSIILNARAWDEFRAGLKLEVFSVLSATGHDNSRSPTATWGLTRWVAKLWLNRPWAVRQRGGARASEGEIADFSVHQLAWWLEPIVSLVVLPVSFYLGVHFVGHVDFSSPGLALFALASFGHFIVTHWPGVYMPQEQGPPQWTPFKNWTDRLNAWQTLTGRTLPSHLPYFVVAALLPHLSLPLALVAGAGALTFNLWSHRQYNEVTAPKEGLPFATHGENAPADAGSEGSDTSEQKWQQLLSRLGVNEYGLSFQDFQRALADLRPSSPEEYATALKQMEVYLRQSIRSGSVTNLGAALKGWARNKKQGRVSAAREAAINEFFNAPSIKGAKAIEALPGVATKDPGDSDIVAELLAGPLVSGAYTLPEAAQRFLFLTQYAPGVIPLLLKNGVLFQFIGILQHRPDMSADTAINIANLLRLAAQAGFTDELVKLHAPEAIKVWERNATFGPSFRTIRQTIEDEAVRQKKQKVNDLLAKARTRLATLEGLRQYSILKQEYDRVARLAAEAPLQALTSAERLVGDIDTALNQTSKPPKETEPTDIADQLMKALANAEGRKSVEPAAQAVKQLARKQEGGNEQVAQAMIRTWDESQNLAALSFKFSLLLDDPGLAEAFVRAGGFNSIILAMQTARGTMPGSVAYGLARLLLTAVNAGQAQALVDMGGAREALRPWIPDSTDITPFRDILRQLETPSIPRDAHEDVRTVLSSIDQKIGDQGIRRVVVQYDKVVGPDGTLKPESFIDETQKERRRIHDLLRLGRTDEALQSAKELQSKIDAFEREVESSIEQANRRKATQEALADARVKEPEYREELGVPSTAGWRQIQLAYRTLSREFHADLNPGDAAAAARSLKINAAFKALALLYDPQSKAAPPSNQSGTAKSLGEGVLLLSVISAFVSPWLALALLPLAGLGLWSAFFGTPAWAHSAAQALGSIKGMLAVGTVVTAMTVNNTNRQSESISGSEGFDTSDANAPVGTAPPAPSTHSKDLPIEDAIENAAQNALRSWIETFFREKKLRIDSPSSRTLIGELQTEIAEGHFMPDTRPSKEMSDLLNAAGWNEDPESFWSHLQELSRQYPPLKAYVEGLVHRMADPAQARRIDFSREEAIFGQFHISAEVAGELFNDIRRDVQPEPSVLGMTRKIFIKTAIATLGIAALITFFINHRLWQARPRGPRWVLYQIRDILPADDQPLDVGKLQDFYEQFPNEITGLWDLDPEIGLAAQQLLDILRQADIERGVSEVYSGSIRDALTRLERLLSSAFENENSPPPVLRKAFAGQGSSHDRPIGMGPGPFGSKLNKPTGQSASLGQTPSSANKNPLSVQSPDDQDFGAASDNSVGFTRGDHEEFHRRGNFKAIIQTIGREIGALEQNGYFDIRGFVRSRGQRDGEEIVLKTAHGEIRLLVDGMLSIMDDRFEIGHAGRNEWAIYAKDRPMARHEIHELRRWARFGMETMTESSKPIATPEQILAGELGTRLRRWLNDPNVDATERSTRQTLVRAKVDEYHQEAVLVETGKRRTTDTLLYVKQAYRRVGWRGRRLEVPDFDKDLNLTDFVIANDNSESEGSDALLDRTATEDLEAYLSGQREIYSEDDPRISFKSVDGNPLSSVQTSSKRIYHIGESDQLLLRDPSSDEGVGTDDIETCVALMLRVTKKDGTSDYATAHFLSRRMHLESSFEDQSEAFIEKLIDLSDFSDIGDVSGVVFYSEPNLSNGETTSIHADVASFLAALAKAVASANPTAAIHIETMTDRGLARGKAAMIMTWSGITLKLGSQSKAGQLQAQTQPVVRTWSDIQNQSNPASDNRNTRTSESEGSEAISIGLSNLDPAVSGALSAQLGTVPNAQLSDIRIFSTLHAAPSEKGWLAGLFSGLIHAIVVFTLLWLGAAHTGQDFFKNYNVHYVKPGEFLGSTGTSKTPGVPQTAPDLSRNADQKDLTIYANDAEFAKTVDKLWSGLSRDQKSLIQHFLAAIGHDKDESRKQFIFYFGNIDNLMGGLHDLAENDHDGPLGRRLFDNKNHQYFLKQPFQKVFEDLATAFYRAAQEAEDRRANQIKAADPHTLYYAPPSSNPGKIHVIYLGIPPHVYRLGDSVYGEFNGFAAGTLVEHPQAPLTLPSTYLAGAIHYLLGDVKLERWQAGDMSVEQELANVLGLASPESLHNDDFVETLNSKLLLDTVVAKRQVDPQLLIQLFGDLGKLPKMGEKRITIKRAIELLFAPTYTYEKEPLLNNPDEFAGQHRNPKSARTAIRHILTAVARLETENAETILRDMLGVMELGMTYEVALAAIKTAFDMDFAQAVKTHGLDAALHFLHNLAHPGAVLSLGPQDRANANNKMSRRTFAVFSTLTLFATRLMAQMDPQTAQTIEAIKQADPDRISQMIRVIMRDRRRRPQTAADYDRFFLPAIRSRPDAAMLFVRLFEATPDPRLREDLIQQLGSIASEFPGRIANLAPPDAFLHSMVKAFHAPATADSAMNVLFLMTNKRSRILAWLIDDKVALEALNDPAALREVETRLRQLSAGQAQALADVLFAGYGMVIGWRARFEAFRLLANEPSLGSVSLQFADDTTLNLQSDLRNSLIAPDALIVYLQVLPKSRWPEFAVATLDILDSSYRTGNGPLAESAWTALAPLLKDPEGIKALLTDRPSLDNRTVAELNLHLAQTLPAAKGVHIIDDVWNRLAGALGDPRRDVREATEKVLKVFQLGYDKPDSATRIQNDLKMLDDSFRLKMQDTLPPFNMFFLSSSDFPQVLSQLNTLTQPEAQAWVVQGLAASKGWDPKSAYVAPEIAEALRRLMSQNGISEQARTAALSLLSETSASAAEAAAHAADQVDFADLNDSLSRTNMDDKVQQAKQNFRYRREIFKAIAQRLLERDLLWDNGDALDPDQTENLKNLGDQVVDKKTPTEQERDFLNSIGLRDDIETLWSVLSAVPDASTRVELLERLLARVVDPKKDFPGRKLADLLPLLLEGFRLNPRLQNPIVKLLAGLDRTDLLVLNSSEQLNLWKNLVRYRKANPSDSQSAENLIKAVEEGLDPLRAKEIWYGETGAEFEADLWRFVTTSHWLNNFINNLGSEPLVLRKAIEQAVLTPAQEAKAAAATGDVASIAVLLRYGQPGVIDEFVMTLGNDIQHTSRNTRLVRVLQEFPNTTAFRPALAEFVRSVNSSTSASEPVPMNDVAVLASVLVAFWDTSMSDDAFTFLNRIMPQSRALQRELMESVLAERILATTRADARLPQWEKLLNQMVSRREFRNALMDLSRFTDDPEIRQQVEQLLGLPAQKGGLVNSNGTDANLKLAALLGQTPGISDARSNRIAAASIAYWSAKAMGKNEATAIRGANGPLGYRTEAWIGRGLAIASAFIPGFFVLPLIFWFTHLIFMGVAFGRGQQAPPGTYFLKHLGMQFLILMSYGLPALITIALNHFLPLLPVELIVAPLAVSISRWAASRHIAYDASLFEEEDLRSPKSGNTQSIEDSGSQIVQSPVEQQKTWVSGRVPGLFESIESDDHAFLKSLGWDVTTRTLRAGDDRFDNVYHLPSQYVAEETDFFFNGKSGAIVTAYDPLQKELVIIRVDVPEGFPWVPNSVDFNPADGRKGVPPLLYFILLQAKRLAADLQGQELQIEQIRTSKITELAAIAELASLSKEVSSAEVRIDNLSPLRRAHTVAVQLGLIPANTGKVEGGLQVPLLNALVDSNGYPIKSNKQLKASFPQIARTGKNVHSLVLRGFDAVLPVEPSAILEFEGSDQSLDRNSPVRQELLAAQPPANQKIVFYPASGADIETPLNLEPDADVYILVDNQYPVEGVAKDFRRLGITQESIPVSSNMTRFEFEMNGKKKVLEYYFQTITSAQEVDAILSSRQIDVLMTFAPDGFQNTKAFEHSLDLVRVGGIIRGNEGLNHIGEVDNQWKLTGNVDPQFKGMFRIESMSTEWSHSHRELAPIIRKIAAGRSDHEDQQNGMESTPRAMNGGELFNHFRFWQVIKGMAGILFNEVRSMFAGKDNLRERLQNQAKVVLGDDAQGITVEELDVHGFRKLWDFGEAKGQVARVNLLLPEGMRLRALVHEILHIKHPEWTESQVIGTTEQVLAAYQSRLQNLPQSLSDVARAVQSARPDAGVADLAPVMNDLLVSIKPKQATSFLSILKSSQEAIIVPAREALRTAA